MMGTIDCTAGNVTTTNATTTTLVTFPFPPNCGAEVGLRVVGRDTSNGDMVGTNRLLRCRTNGTTLSPVGAATILSGGSDAPLAACVISFDTDGALVGRVRVTGINGKTIKWEGTIEPFIVA